MTFSYCRVSTKEQNEDRQIIALESYGISKKNIFIDKESGKDFNRKNYRKLMKKLKSGDILVIKSIDRLGRNYNDVLDEWRNITKVKNVDIIVLDMPLLDTTKHKDLIGTLISDIVLQLLSYVAENERTNIRQRQAEGIAAAKVRGVRFGRPPLPIPQNFNSILNKCENSEISMRNGAKECGMAYSTFRDKLKKSKESD
ncbi:MAG: recombinase family protein [Firmicutes bacterium]|nr:recombinase family protein [Bacillota bacterium]